MKLRIPISLLALLLPAVISAQTPERPDAGADSDTRSVQHTISIREVPVWGRRPMQEIGVQKTQLDSSVLKQNIALSMADILTYNTPLFVKQYGRATLSTVSFRGTGPSHTQVTWNGMRINSPMLGMTDFSMIPSYFIDDAALLYGTSSVNETGGALGGVVKLATTPARADGFGLQYIQGIGMFRTFDEFLRLMYKTKGYRLSLYLENYFDDFSGMGKLNGFDGLWGLEYASSNPRSWLRGAVLEYYQTTHQSGPLHGSDADTGEKTGGADDYYNNYLYQGWTHWGQAMGNPLIASPAYFLDRIVQSPWGKGYMGFPYNRVRAFHLGLHGSIAPRWGYRLKCTVSRTWGTPLAPILEPLDNVSGFLEAQYEPAFWEGLRIVSSLSFDSGDIYGDSFGWQLKVRKNF